jgi:hypothetical protein
VRIVGATLTQFEDAFRGNPLYGYYDEAKESKRQAVNAWIRTSGAFDGVIDFDAATRDPANPRHIRAEYDKGDHLHPNDAGYEAMAESVDLGLLGVRQSPTAEGRSPPPPRAGGTGPLRLAPDSTKSHPSAVCAR